MSECEWVAKWKEKAYNNIGSGIKEKTMQKHVCDLCGYIYDPEQGDPAGGVQPGTPFEAIPGDWVCPLCGASKDKFYTVD